MFINSIIKKGAVYCTTDISKPMLDRFQTKLESSDIYASKTIHFESFGETDKVDAITASQDDKITRTIYSVVANNEKLPFEDSSFDRYISSMSLMIVENPNSMLKEAYRVLEKGGLAGFSVWGRPENCTSFTILPEAWSNCGLNAANPMADAHSFCDMDKMKQHLEEAGFTDVKMFYSPATIVFEDKEDLLDFHMQNPGIAEVFKPLSQQQQKEIKEEYFRLYEDKFGDHTIDVPSFEVLIATAKKVNKYHSQKDMNIRNKICDMVKIKYKY
jgi:SAM-dependent methyltransferase